jgi:hypothetical protein
LTTIMVSEKAFMELPWADRCRASGRAEAVEGRAAPRRVATMDKKQQAERIQKIVDTIALKAIEFPLEARPAFIEGEVARVREAFRQTYEADPRLAACAMELVDQMDEWIRERVQILEVGDGKTGTA